MLIFAARSAVIVAVVACVIVGEDIGMVVGQTW